MLLWIIYKGRAINARPFIFYYLTFYEIHDIIDCKKGEMEFDLNGNSYWTTNYFSYHTNCKTK